ncbi:hypothetical protein F5Y15DRAFT_421940 [Xylariaceae sp. FL0016]|nr:hypothetical protein F5Y15DRAFT_421940 [Xylariaceae sp. FL0016]
MASAKRTARLRQVVVISALCLAVYLFLWIPDDAREGSGLGYSRSAMWNTYPNGLPRTPPQTPLTGPEGTGKQQQQQQQRERAGEPEGKQLPEGLRDNRFLTEAQCRNTFPGLLKEVDDAVAKGPFTLERNPLDLGPLIARIQDGKLYILSYARKSDLSRDMLQHRSATLHQLANALLTWPPSSPPPPDTVLAFNHHDDPLASTFSYSRPADPVLDTPSRHFFPIPHFAFYSWPLPFVGSLPRASAAIAALEAFLPFGAKLPLAVWRGTTWYNNARAGRMRQNLVHAARGQPWADVQALNWVASPPAASPPRPDRSRGSPSHNSPQTADNAIPIEDFCTYKYILHTEGITYSGRFPMHQLCRSVILTPPISWLQHTTHLLRPLFSHALANVSRIPIPLPHGETNPLLPYPAPWVQSAWPKEYGEDEANIVFVAPDWSDLADTIAWLEARPDVAEGIATRQRDLFHGKGYLSPAAEMCYWRGLIRGWSEVVRYEGQGFDEMDGIPWEEFSLLEVHK